MPRTKHSVARRKRRKKILKMAKGFRGARSKLFKTAKDAVTKALQHQYRHRRMRRRLLRQLWIIRINAFCRQEGISYSKFIGALGKAGIKIDRKVLADLAVRNPNALSTIILKAKEYL
ncbi:MAG: 50S ribosomal protein L20 [bacterium]